VSWLPNNGRAPPPSRKSNFEFLKISAKHSSQYYGFQGITSLDITLFFNESINK